MKEAESTGFNGWENVEVEVDGPQSGLPESDPQSGNPGEGGMVGVAWRAIRGHAETYGLYSLDDGGTLKGGPEKSCSCTQPRKSARKRGAELGRGEWEGEERQRVSIRAAPKEEATRSPVVGAVSAQL